MCEQSPLKDPTLASQPAASGSWLRRHRPEFIVGTLLLAVLLVAQVPMLKSMASRLVGVGPPDDGIPWRSDFPKAMEESRQTGKPVLVNFWATWCPPCQTMKYDAWPDPRVRQAIMASYIPVAVDIDAGGSEVLARRYDITTIPAILIVDSDGKIVRQRSYMSRSTLLDFLASLPL